MAGLGASLALLVGCDAADPAAAEVWLDEPPRSLGGVWYALPQGDSSNHAPTMIDLQGGGQAHLIFDSAQGTRERFSYEISDKRIIVKPAEVDAAASPSFTAEYHIDQEQMTLRVEGGGQWVFVRRLAGDGTRDARPGRGVTPTRSVRASENRRTILEP